MGGFFFDFELFRTASGPSRRVRESLRGHQDAVDAMPHRTESSDRDAPRRSVSTILKGVLSFMLSDEITTGAVECSDAERRRLAQASVAWNTSQPEFNALFPDFAELREEELRRRARPRNAGLIARGALDEAGLPGAAASKACGDALFRAKNYEKRSYGGERGRATPV